MPRYRSTTPRPALPRRTLDYLERGALEGSRNAELFDAACQFRDAGFGQDEAEGQLMARAMADGLGESEARHAIGSAFSQAAREAIVPLRTGRLPPPPHAAEADHRPKFVAEPLELPAPPEGGFLRLLEACFGPDDLVAIAPGMEDDEGNVVPKRGVTLSVADWRKRVESKGGIDRCFSTKLGLFVRLNPMQQGGSRNDEVTAFRHVLVEFDRDASGADIPKGVQFGAIVASGLPVSAVIDSGNKSIHAWVRVDAPDAGEYRRRVDIVWDWLDGLNLDKKNKNPSRFSRCPDGWRTVDGEKRRQRLLAIGLGAKSWAEWEVRMIDDQIERMPVSALAVYDTSNDPNSVLGDRWLCRSGSLVIVGQSGIGKSSFCMQVMILWALGRPAFGIAPTAGRPIKSLLIQAENDIGDLAEMYQGVRAGMGLTPEEERLLEDRIFIYRDTTHTGEEFTALAAKLIERHKPDIVWADPLLNYIGDDISEQKVVAEFCCNRLNSIGLQTGVIWALLHHTGKPSKDPKAGTHWTASDLAYSGLGSSALVNWSRETAVIMRVKAPDGTPPTFQLSMTKRRQRAGLRDMLRTPTDTIFIRHSGGSGICWEQCAPPPAPSKGAASYSVGKPGRPSTFDEGKFRAVLDEFGGSLTRENENEVAAKFDVSVRTIWNWHKRFSANPQ
ncbi:MAG: AAA family ATPase [Chthoniobacterales bacterium]|nr:AAA family ATPase [Chthoniobacterales bacterium]